MAKKISGQKVGHNSLLQLRENNRKNSVGGPGSYANSDLAKARNTSRKTIGGFDASNADAAKARDAAYQAKQKASFTNGLNTTNADLAKQRDAQHAAKGSVLGASGKNGGNPCHDSEGKFC